MSRRICAQAVRALLLASTLAGRVQPQTPAVTARNDSISIRLVDVDIRSAVQLLAPFLDKPVLFSGPGGVNVTLETPTAIPRAEIHRLLSGLLDGNGYELVDDTTAGLLRVRARRQDPAPTLAPGAGTGGPVNADSMAGRLVVVPLQHARAIDVASTVNALYGAGGDMGGAVGPRVRTLAEQLQGNLVPPQGELPEPRADAGGSGGSLSGSLTIVADTRTNSLLVRANGADLALIRSVVTALDVRPLQVLIEVLVAEVRRDKSLGINVEGELAPTTIGRNGATIEGAIGEAGLGDFAIRVMGIGGMDLTGTLRLASGRGNVRILTRPIVLATNNETAEIVVGSQRPFVQVQRALPTDAAARDQIVQYKDVGTKLTVRPTISSDGTVQLEVMQEVSTATSELAFNAPVIATRSVRTQLLVRDGQTVALGGLTDRQVEKRQGGLPFLSAIPWIGGLFGRASSQEIESELFVFLTPRVIRTDDDAMRISDPLRQRTGERP